MKLDDWWYWSPRFKIRKLQYLSKLTTPGKALFDWKYESLFIRSAMLLIAPKFDNLFPRYTRTGPDTSKCQGDGTWSKLPACVAPGKLCYKAVGELRPKLGFPLYDICFLHCSLHMDLRGVSFIIIEVACHDFISKWELVRVYRITVSVQQRPSTNQQNCGILWHQKTVQM